MARTRRYHAWVANPPELAQRARRRDARENRARIIAAARRVFASSGFEAPLSAIAAEAGVGRATLYRNFEDRIALVVAIFEDNLRALEDLAREHRGQPDAFMALLSAIVEQQVEAHALFPMLLTGKGAPDVDALARRATSVLRAPLRAAVAAGVVRGDLTLSDVLCVLAMLSAVVLDDLSPSAKKKRARRALQLVLDGIVPR